MIKRRFYKLEHGGRDEPSESSSSSDSEVEPESTDESGEEEDGQEEGNVVSKSREYGEASSSSGYETEDSSINEVNLDSSGLPTSDDDTSTQIGGENILGSIPSSAEDTVLANDENSPEKEKTSIDLPDWILKCKSVYKCRLCPRIVCLSEETLKAHLISKRHARSEKLRKEGRLKLMLNGSGQIEGETDDPENPAATTVSGRKSGERKKKGKGQGKQKKRSRQETRFGKGRPTGRREKRRKNDD